MNLFGRQDEINEAIARGDLEGAMEYFEDRKRRAQLQPSELVRIRQRITAALIDRANASISTENLVAAWRDLSFASDLAAPSDVDAISKRVSQLVELTIENADALLISGKANHATQLINELSERKIQDWRVDQIRQVAICLQDAESLAAEGRFSEAIVQLENARSLKPEVAPLKIKIEAHQKRLLQMDELSKHLQAAALRNHWKEVNEYCEQILKLAPHHEIAIAAKKHAMQRIKRQTNAGSRNTHVPERVTDSNSFFQFDRREDGSYSPSQSGPTSLEAADERPVSAMARTDSFLVWVDGVGGYLVCTDPICLIGQAMEGTTVSIPLQADLRSRHARLELIAGQHLIQPLGHVTLDNMTKETAFVILNGQTLGLGEGVRLKYSQPHPLSKTSRLDFVSRHRTQPWSDGVILASQSIIFGPNRNNHVHCPRWKDDLIFFRRDEVWYCRRRLPFVVDGKGIERETEIRFNSHIYGDDFSLTLEPVFKQPLAPYET